jgi:hypothetical protein
MGDVSQVAGFGLLDIGDTVDVNPGGQRTSRKWELGVFPLEYPPERYFI